MVVYEDANAAKAAIDWFNGNLSGNTNTIIILLTVFIS